MLVSGDEPLDAGPATSSSATPDADPSNPSSNDAAATQPTAGSAGSTDVAGSGSAGGLGGAGVSGNAGAAGSVGSSMDVDAGSAQPGNTPIDPAKQAEEEIACAFGLSGCLILAPLNVAECLRMNACDFLTAFGIPVDGGTPPSASCGMQAADCIMRNPERAQECVAMLNTCTM